MADADVVISWFASVPASVKSAFQRPTQYVQLPPPPNRAYKDAVQALGWPDPVGGAIRKYLPGVTAKRVALLGFSEGCHGLRNLLSSGDGLRIDSVLAIDGVHTPYVSGKQVDPNTMAPWFEFGKLAVVNERLFVDTHSSIVPPGFASTTETADYLWNKLTNSSPAFTEPPLPDMSVPPMSVHVGAPPATKPYDVAYPAPAWQPHKRAGGLVILGCDNRDVPAGYADHIYQAKAILPLTITRFLAMRWNNMDPEAPGQSCYYG
jgi:hypothetical protein